MNRSFLYGILVASSTWCFSLYLYWLLIRQQQDSNPYSLSDNDGDKSRALAKYQNININTLNGNHYRKPDKSFFEDKLLRYKKEKKFRKISQKLIDEIKPVEQSIKDGKQQKKARFYVELFTNSNSNLSLSLFLFHFQMNLVWSVMLMNNISETLATNDMHLIL